MTFEEWWAGCVRPYVPKGSELEQTIYPWVADAWKYATQQAVEPDAKKTAPDN